MLNKEELRKQIIQYFRSVGSGENIVQCIKEALFLHQQFNPVLLFQRLSKGKQKLTKDDWRNYLVARSISFSEEQIKYFFNLYSFSEQITLNEFLESMIPYNADVIREFKAKYLDSLQVRQFDVEVEFIFSQLMSNWIKFIRNLIKVRSEISRIATKKQIQQLIKEDLVLKSKPREARKFHQAFQARGFVGLGFHELRKFLQLWLTEKEIIHQFYLLNVKRHLKCEHPFDRIVFKSSRISKNKTESQRHRSMSAQKISNKINLTNEKLREEVGKESVHRKFDTIDFRGNLNGSAEKYDDFKRKIIEDYEKEKHELQRSRHEKQSKRQYEAEEENSYIKQSRYHRQQKGIDGTYVVNIFEEIIRKQERLEKLRKHLAKLNDYNLINLFRLIDYRNQGYVTAKDLSDFTGDARVVFNHLVNFYARESNKLRFHEFCIFFRPLSKQLNDIIDSRPEHRVPNPFKRETNKLILEVLHITAELHTNLFHIRQSIDSSHISSKKLFVHVDLHNKGYITAQCIKTLLEENNIFCEGKDLKCLMKYFRKKVDERISIDEFINFIDL